VGCADVSGVARGATALNAKVMIALNTAWNLVNFRAGLINALIAQGYEVVAVAPHDEYALHLVQLGCNYIPLAMDNKGTNPGRDFLLLVRFLKLMRAERPDVFLGYTVKPNVYGSLAARALMIPVINNVAGLGTVFIKGGWLNQLVRWLYRIALSRSAKVFFQNEDDRQLFVSGGLVSETVTDRLPGSGVDLVKFRPMPLPARHVVRFLLISRMLWDKGVGDFVEAARLLKQRGIDAECCLLGFLDVQNPTAISRKQMDKWVAEGVVRYLGVSDNVRKEIAQADCIVLPSFYREGTPRTLLEAAAMARPIVTTDSVGCRDVVDHGLNGFLCKPKDASDLADKMGHIVSLSPAEREFMGLRGREKVEREFDEQIVIDKYISAIEAVLAKKLSEMPYSAK
jgi:glycosyltransferase involved in cell wall biosynthesis